MSSNYKKRYAIDKKNEERLLTIKPDLDNESGIYVLTRFDENNIKYAYIGQAKHVLKRLVGHLSGYQHIDLSLRKHGFYPYSHYGWRIGVLHYPEEKLDEMEKHWIQRYAADGYQLRNKTAGGQGEGKVQIDEYRPSKGYRDGITQGRVSLAKELKSIITKHLMVTIQPGKENHKVSQRMYAKFFELINEGSKENEE